jgi:ketosteroid isomerase-like protein
MTADRVETVRRIYEEWARGNFRAGTELFDPNVLLVLRPEFPEQGAYVGLERISAYMRDLLASYTGFAIAGKDFVAAGDSVVVELHQTGTGATSGVPTDHHYFQVWTFRGDSVIRIESINDRRDALAVVGLGD